MSSSSGIRISHPQLEPLRPVLQAWIDCVHQYVELFGGGDLPYWYNERANVGLLSAAAWKAGFVSLEEFQSAKLPKTLGATTVTVNQPEGNPEIKNSKGRCDLYLANSSHEFFVEAKVCYPSIKTLENCFEKGMKMIAQDKRNVGDADSHHLAALFCVPYADNLPADAQAIAQHLALAQAHAIDAHAWVQPALAQTTPSHNHCFYPLVSLFIQVVHAAESDATPEATNRA